MANESLNALVDSASGSDSIWDCLMPYAFGLSRHHFALDRRPASHWKNGAERNVTSWLQETSLLRGVIHLNIGNGSLIPSPAYLLFKRLARFYGFDHVFAGYVGSTYRMIHFNESVATDGRTEYPKQRNDGWMEVELGENFVTDGGQDGDFKMTLVAGKAVNWKRGIIIQGIEIRPKYQN
ncbi:hypothetical protein BUALT_Bualt12G0012900 [Buddleja alternifolia]|uniref:Uncharacterized protein n=1 Tax=Buddleja alternifolia TaxID=168488 RepID=A0AAV6WPA5_9LAMI|nr:hypothetical protein BUALT_Bualt12G0012900 [Buddleja alternifolia]